MSNPTLGAGQQFNGPFDILPNLVYTNPTAQNNSQFIEPYNINTKQESYISQNISTLSPGYLGGIQFVDDYNINTNQENIISQNISVYNPTIAGNITQTAFNINTNQENIISQNISTYNPTVNSQQFTSFNINNINPTSIGLASQLLVNNPTFNNNIQFEFPYNIDTNQENIISNNLSTYNPTVNNNIQFDSTYASTPGYSGNPFNAIPSTILSSGFSLDQNAVSINVTGSFTNLTNARFLRNGFGYASSIAAGVSGIPQIGQSAQKIFDTTNGTGDVDTGTYFTLPFDQLTNKINYAGSAIDIANSVGNLAPYPDFRAKRFASSFANQNANLAVKISSAIGKARKDGGSAAIRSGTDGNRAALYAAASISPAGAYALFNLNGVGQFGYGWGDHDNEYALRSDFTLRSEVSTKWSTTGTGSFVRSTNALDKVTPFRGDKVTVIDFGQRLLKNAYQWKPSPDGSTAASSVPKTSLTKDFIKFFLTGPSLTATDLFGNGTSTKKDDIIVFRAILTSLSDSFSPQWTDVKMIGRADPNYQYTSYARSLSVDFDIVITDRDEIKPTWRKLNALAGYCAPIYDETSIALVGPWMRITLGDLFHQTPVVLDSLSYTYDLDHSWEINIEGDKEMFETPRKISVSCTFKVITDTLPQNNGRFFGLAKEYDSKNLSIAGNNNWLSDFKPTAPDPRFLQGETILTNTLAAPPPNPDLVLGDQGIAVNLG